MQIYFTTKQWSSAVRLAKYQATGIIYNNVLSTRLTTGGQEIWLTDKEASSTTESRTKSTLSSNVGTTNNCLNIPG